MDLRMPRLDGIEAIRRLAARGERPRAIALTTYADDASVLGALRAGARGYLTKDAGAEEIRAAVEAVARGEAALDPSVQHHVVAALSAGAPRRAPRRAHPARGRGARADRRGAQQRPDRRAPGGERGDGEDARQPHLRQGRGARPRAGRGLRVLARARELGANPERNRRPESGVLLTDSLPQPPSSKEHTDGIQPYPRPATRCAPADDQCRARGRRPRRAPP